jgi:hypothetical protein
VREKRETGVGEEEVLFQEEEEDRRIRGGCKGRELERRQDSAGSRDL